MFTLAIGPMASGQGYTRARAGSLINEGEKAFNRGDFQSAFRLWEQSLEIYKRLDDKEAMGIMSNNLGVRYLQLGNYSRALDYFQKALVLRRQVVDRKGEGADLTNIGVVYAKLGKHNMALEYYQKALQIKREIGDSAGIARNIGNIGAVHLELGENIQALDYFQQSLKITQKIGDKEGEARALGNISVIYNKIGKDTLALEFSQHALIIIRSGIHDRIGEAVALTNIGNVYKNFGEYYRAIEYFQQALEIQKYFMDNRGMVDNLNNIALIYEILGEYSQALACYQQALNIMEEHAELNNDIEYFLTQIGTVHLNLHEYAQALEYYQKALKNFRQEQGYNSGQAAALNNIGAVYVELGQYSQAIDYCQQALKIAKEIVDREDEGKALNNIGVAYENLGNYSLALNYYQQALQVRTEIDNKKGIGISLGNIGVIYKFLSEYSRALDYLQRAIKICREVKERHGEGNALGNIAAAYLDLNEYSRALDYAQQALNINRELYNRKSEARNLTTIGAAYHDMGEFPQALDYYYKALIIDRELKDKKHEEADLSNMGVIYDQAGEYSLALEYYQQALKLARESEDKNKKGEIGILSNIGVSYYRIGEYPRALNYFQQALNLDREFKDKKGEGGDLHNIGMLYQDIGDYSQALDFLQQALKIRKEMGDKKKEAECLTNIGVVYRELGKYSQALDSCKHALNIMREIDAKKAMRAVQANIGDIYFERGQIQEALAYYQETGDPSRLGKVYNKLGEYEKTLDYFSEAFQNELQKEHKNIEVLSRGYLIIGEAMEGLNRWEEAVSKYLAAIETIEQVRGKLQALEQKSGFLSVQLQPYENMIRVFYMLHLKRQIPPDTLKYWGKNYAEIALHFTERAKARSLVEMLARVRTEKVIHLLPLSLAEKETRLTNYLGNLEGQIDQAFEKGKEVQQVLARNIKETRAELEALIAQNKKDYPDYAALRYPEAVTVTKLPLQDNERLLEYQVTDDATYLFVVQQNKVDKFLKIPISRKDLEDKVRHFRIAFEKLEKFEDLNRFNPLEAQELYNLLLAPALRGLDRNQHLILVPDGPLHLLPFEALVVDTTKTTKTVNPDINVTSYQGLIYLADQWELSYYQSATVMAVNRIGKPTKTSWQKPFFAMGDPVFDENDPRALGRKVAAAIKAASAETVMPQEVMLPKKRAIKERGFPIDRLPETTDEIAAIAKLLGVAMNSPDIKLGLAANEMALKQMNLLGHQYLTFATHGFLADDIPYIQEPALMLTQVDKGEEDGFFTMSEVLGLRLNAELVTLSACETGLGKQVKGEGVVGLSRAFMYAGTKSLLVSLWSVSSKSTEIFMTTFYNYLKQGKGKAAALRRAKQELRNSRFEIELEVSRGIAVKGKTVKIMMEGSHPYFWAPFVLIGEWE